jgi:hypothetical protein
MKKGLCGNAEAVPCPHDPRQSQSVPAQPHGNCSMRVVLHIQTGARLTSEYCHRLRHINLLGDLTVIIQYYLFCVRVKLGFCRKGRKIFTTFRNRVLRNLIRGERKLKKDKIT